MKRRDRVQRLRHHLFNFHEVKLADRITRLVVPGANLPLMFLPVDPERSRGRAAIPPFRIFRPFRG